jgi:hypothetical protein
MNEIQTVVQRYLDGLADLEETAAQLFELWKTQGWGFYLDPASVPPDQLARARRLEQRFCELASQAAPPPAQ